MSSFSKLAEDFGECEAICLSQDIRRKNLKNIQVFPWRDGLKKFFTKKV